jgi:ABC-type bacteriocin/lantibiotic exporter with double-glycine peptidase domain
LGGLGRAEMGVLELEDVSKRFHRGREDVVALAGVTLAVSPGEFVAVAGPSGSGKSTLLHLAGGLDQPDGGRVLVDGRDLKSAISHLKIVIVDGVYTVRGSTNWSLSGETQQDNELTLSRNAVIAAETRAVLDLNHDWMLKQMSKSGQALTRSTKKTATKKTATKKGRR